MQQIGIVEDIKDNYAKIRIQRITSCGENCASCKGGCKPTDIFIEAIVGDDISIGEKVIIETENKKIFLATFIVYTIPLIFLIGGYFFGYYIFKNEGFSILTGIFLMCLCYIIVHKIDKYFKNIFTTQIIKMNI